MKGERLESLSAWRRENAPARPKRPIKPSARTQSDQRCSLVRLAPHEDLAIALDHNGFGGVLSRVPEVDLSAAVAAEGGVEATSGQETRDLHPSHAGPRNGSHEDDSALRVERHVVRLVHVIRTNPDFAVARERLVQASRNAMRGSRESEASVAHFRLRASVRAWPI